MRKQLTEIAVTAPDGNTAKVYFTHKELARHFGVNRATIAEWKKRGMPYLNLKPEAMKPFCRFNVAEVEEWLRLRAAARKEERA